MQFGKRRASVVTAAVMTLCTATGAYLAVPAFAAGPKVAANPSAALVAGTPCTATARSCVDLETDRAWLLDKGKITRGPVKVSSGGNGKATPIGHSLRVYRKDKDHKSSESKLPNGQPAPMPWAVFFEDGGIAFHSGSPSRSSSGCIHLSPADAQAWFNYLEIGDQVQVVKASQELAKHKGQPTVDPKVGTGDSGASHDDGDDNDDSGDDHDDDDDD